MRALLAASALLLSCGGRSELIEPGARAAPVDASSSAAPDALALDAAADPDSGARPDAVDLDAGIVPLTYWRDVYPIVFARCTYCHAYDERDRLAGLPPIVTYQNTQARSDAFRSQTVAQRMAARVLNAAGRPGDMPQRGSPFGAAMTIEERRTIAAWVEQGAIEGPRPIDVVFPDASQ